MKLQRGCCTFCLENNRVVTSEDAEGFLNLLPNIFPEQTLNINEFNKIKRNLKICVICCQKLCLANTSKNNVEEYGEQFNSCCGFCQKEVHVIEIESDWKYFHERSDCLKYSKSNKKNLFVCLDCLFYVDTVFNMKIRLFTKFPQVKLKDVTSKRSPSTSTTSPSSSRTPKSAKRHSTNATKIKISYSKNNNTKNCFTSLQPLSSSPYNITKTLYNDEKMYKKIPYVDITREAKRTPISKIKIRLRSPSKKKQRRSINKGLDDTSITAVIVNKYNGNNGDDGDKEELSTSMVKKRPFVKLLKSGEIDDGEDNTEKSEYTQENIDENGCILDTPKSIMKKRRISQETSENNQENIINIDEETPKSKLPPRRRSSIFVTSIENGEEIEKETSPTPSSPKSDIIESEHNESADKEEKNMFESEDEKDDNQINKEDLDEILKDIEQNCEDEGAAEKATSEESYHTPNGDEANQSSMDDMDANGQDRKKKKVTFSFSEDLE